MHDWHLDLLDLNLPSFDYNTKTTTPMISLLQLTMTRQAHKYIFEWSTPSIGSLWMNIKKNPKTVSPKTKQSTDNSVQLNESNKVVWVACLPLLSVYIAQLRRFCESEMCTSFAYVYLFVGHKHATSTFYAQKHTQTVRYRCARIYHR